VKNMQILYSTFTANTQVSTQPCFYLGAQIQRGSATSIEIFDEADSTATATKRVDKLAGTMEDHKIPLPGIKCSGLYAKFESGKETYATVYYYH